MQARTSSLRQGLGPCALVILVLLAAADTARAQVSVTISSGNTVSMGDAQLFLSGDWTNEGTFVAGSSTVVFYGSATQTLSHTLGAFNNLTVDKPGGDLLLNDNVTVDGELTVLNGDLDLNGQQVDLGTTGVLSETPGNTVKGTAGVITATRTLNAPNENVAGLGATITSSANLGVTTISRGHAQQSINVAQSVLRYFDINPTNNAGLNATLEFHYDESELNGLPEAPLVLFRSQDSGATWTFQGGTANPGGNSVSLAGISAFSRWALGTGVIHVENIVTGSVGAGMGNKRGTATVTIFDHQGNPVSGALVTGTFSGEFNEAGASGTTGLDGMVTIQTQVAKKIKGNAVINFCVTDVQGGLPYDPNENADPAFACDTATDMHVAALSTGQQNTGGGNKQGTATVTIHDDLGNPVAGAAVTGTFSGDFNETVGPVITNASGQAVLATTQVKKGKLTFDFCVDTVAGALPYDPNDNADPAFDCDGLPKRESNSPDDSATDPPLDYALSQNYPNPFNPTTQIRFTLPETAPVHLAVYDVLGRRVRVLVEGVREAGTHEVTFDASAVPSGTYYYRLTAGSFMQTRHMLLMK